MLVDRLERASKPGGCWGLSRSEVMESMYGRADPKPRAPTFDDRERTAMADADRRDLITRQTALAVRGAVIAAASVAPDDGALLSAAGQEPCRSTAGNHESSSGVLLVSSVGDAAWNAVETPQGFGLAVNSRVKWRQTQTHVEVFVRLPEPLAIQLTAGRSIRSKVLVDIHPTTLQVEFVGARDTPVCGQLYAAICADDSTWFMDDGMIQITLLKRCRRGHYAAGTTNANTWWRSLLTDVPLSACLPGPHPPAAYYSSPYQSQ